MTDSSPFDVLAHEYDAVRRAYVPELIDDVLAFAQLGDSDHVLEVGCGPGTATRLFAPRVPRLTAVEPSARFVDIARENLAAHAHVDVEHARFEEWDGPTEHFALLYGARSFQWIPAEARFARPARHLCAGGTLALFWHWPVIPDGSFLAEVQDLCDVVWPPRRDGTPRLGTPRRGVDERVATWSARFSETDRFGAVDVRRYPWSRTYDEATFLRLMNTWPLHRHLEDATRTELESKVRGIFDRRGGEVVGDYETALFLARRV